MWSEFLIRLIRIHYSTILWVKLWLSKVGSLFLHFWNKFWYKAVAARTVRTAQRLTGLNWVSKKVNTVSGACLIFLLLRLFKNKMLKIFFMSSLVLYLCSLGILIQSDIAVTLLSTHELLFQLLHCSLIDLQSVNFLYCQQVHSAGYTFHYFKWLECYVPIYCIWVVWLNCWITLLFYLLFIGSLAISPSTTPQVFSSPSLYRTF